MSHYEFEVIGVPRRICSEERQRIRWGSFPDDVPQDSVEPCPSGLDQELFGSHAMTGAPEMSVWHVRVQSLDSGVVRSPALHLFWFHCVPALAALYARVQSH
jgi:hypothetical protein